MLQQEGVICNSRYLIVFGTAASRKSAPKADSRKTTRCQPISTRSQRHGSGRSELPSDRFFGWISVRSTKNKGAFAMEAQITDNILDLRATNRCLNRWYVAGRALSRFMQSKRDQRHMSSTS